MTNGKQTTLNFALEKTTPGAVRFQEVDAAGEKITISAGAMIGTLYVRKTALNGVIPQHLKVTVEAV